MNTRLARRTALPVSITALMATALPAGAAPPTTFPVENEEIRVTCDGERYAGTGNGTYSVLDADGSGHFLGQTTFHIVWEFVNEGDALDTFTYIDTGVAHRWVNRDDLETTSVSGHTTATPDLALHYGRWVDNEDGSAIRGHDTECTLNPFEPAPWMEIIPFEGHLHGHQFPPGAAIEFRIGDNDWIPSGEASQGGEVLILHAFEPRTAGDFGDLDPGEVVALRAVGDREFQAEITVVDLTYDYLDLGSEPAAAGGAAVGVHSDQLLFCYDGNCVPPSVQDDSWSINPSDLAVGDDPSFINYFDAEGDAQQVVDPRYLP
jgi:hypothetical protein